MSTTNNTASTTSRTPDEQYKEILNQYRYHRKEPADKVRDLIKNDIWPTVRKLQYKLGELFYLSDSMHEIDHAEEYAIRLLYASETWIATRRLRMIASVHKKNVSDPKSKEIYEWIQDKIESGKKNKQKPSDSKLMKELKGIKESIKEGNADTQSAIKESAATTQSVVRENAAATQTVTRESAAATQTVTRESAAATQQKVGNAAKGLKKQGAVTQQMIGIAAKGLKKQGAVTQKMVSGVGEKVDVVGEKVDTLKDMLTDYQSSVEKVWRSILTIEEKIKEELQKSGDKVTERIQELEKELQDMYDTISSKTVEIVKNSTDECIGQIKEKIQNKLKGAYKDNWDALDDISKERLISAKVLLACSQEQGLAEYSGIATTAIGALELELKQRFYDGARAYFLNKNVPNSRMPAPLYQKQRNDPYRGDPDGRPLGFFSLGQLPAVLSVDYDPIYREEFTYECNGKSNTIRPRDIMRQYLREIISSAQLNGFSNTPERLFYVFRNNTSFAEKIQSLNTDYRVDATHSGTINEQKACECLKKVDEYLKDLLSKTDRFINYKRNNFNFQ